MPVSTDNSAVSEPDSHSDSDWLDIASTDRDSDDNDSIYSSRETDHEDLSRSRSRRSSLSYGSSRDGDVDAWEGLIEDSADEGMPNDASAPLHHVPSFSRQLAPIDLDSVQECSPEEMRVKEGLDQSMISTLSSSRSSSLHASTVHNSSRDLRLSFPDPITSSLVSASFEEIQPNSDIPSSLIDTDVSSDARQDDDEDMLSDSHRFLTQSFSTTQPSPSGPELKVFLYGFSTALKWSIIDRLLHKVAHGAGFTITPDLDSLQGSIRRLTVSGSFESDRAFPRVITVLDRTLESQYTVDDPALIDFTGVRPLAVIFIPCHPLRLPEHVLYLPVHVLPSYSSGSFDLSNVKAGAPQGTWDVLGIPNQQVLRITAEDDSSIVDKDSVDLVDPSFAYRAFSRLWSGDNNVSKGIIASTYALTIIAILSLVLGVVVRAAIPISLQQFSSPTLAAFNLNCTSGSLLQMLRPAPYRERLPPSTNLEGSVATIPPFKEISLSVFSVETTSMIVSRANPTDFRRMIPSTLSGRLEFSKELILQPPRSVLPPDNRPKALSVIPETTSTISYPAPASIGHPVSTFVYPSVSDVVKECVTVAVAVMNRDMQDVLDALDVLAQAISRQTDIMLTQAATFIEQSAMQSVESFEMVKEALYMHNERARRRAREIRERGTKWLSDASEAIATGAQYSKGVAWEVAESLAHRAQRARGKAKEMAAEIQDFLNEQDGLEALGTSVWDLPTKQWDEWVKRMSKQGKQGKSCRPPQRKLQSAMC